VLTTGPQLRAARSMAALTRDELALAASVGPATVTRLEAEAGRLPATLATLDSLTRVLEAAGVQFTEDGVRARRPIPGPRRR
jgi:DNA-binding XRE family transcriptional regulator